MKLLEIKQANVKRNKVNGAPELDTPTVVSVLPTCFTGLSEVSKGSIKGTFEIRIYAGGYEYVEAFSLKDSATNRHADLLAILLNLK